MFFKIWTYCQAIRFKLVVMLIIILLDACLAAFSISMVLPITSSAVGGGSSETSWITDYIPDFLSGSTKLLLFGLAAVLFLQFIISTLRTVLAVHYTENLRFEWQTTLSRKYILLPYATLSGERQGHLVNNLVKETDQAAIFVFSYLAYLSQVIIMFFVLALLFTVNWVWLSVAAVVGALGWVVVGRPYFLFARKLGQKGVVLNQSLNSIMFESLHGIKDIKISNSEAFQISKIREVAAEDNQNRIMKKIAQAFPQFGKNAFIACAVAIVAIWLPSNLAVIKNIMPQIVLFLVASTQIFTNLSNITTLRFKVMSKFPSFLLIAQRIEHDDTPTESLSRGEKISDIDENIEIRNISFSYDGNSSHCVLFDASAIFKRGETICLSGPSGAGKTTLIDLLVRLYDPDSGDLLIDGKNSRDISLESWRRLIGYVPQEPVIYYGTIRENLTLGRNDITEEDIDRACRISTVNEFIQDMPDGLDTVLCERGGNLSGGQKKRLALARAIAHRSQLIILDETTNAIQESAERALIQNLQQEKDLSLIIISHRDSTEELADRHYTIEGKKIKQLK